MRIYLFYIGSAERSTTLSGTWRLAYNGEISGPLSPSITAAQVKTALDALASLDSVTVTGSSGSFSVSFGGTQANTNMNSLFGDAADATNGSILRTITTGYDANDQVISISDPSATINTKLYGARLACGEPYWLPAIPGTSAMPTSTIA